MIQEQPMTTQQILDATYREDTQLLLSSYAEADMRTARQGIAVNLSGLLGDCQLTYVGRNRYRMTYFAPTEYVVEGTKQKIKPEVMAGYEVSVAYYEVNIT